MVAKKPAVKKGPKTKAQTSEQFQELANNLPDNSDLSLREQENQASANAGIRAATADTSPEKVIAQLTGIQLNIGATLQQVQGQLIAATQELATVRTAVKLENEELERLYGVDIAKSKIEDLVHDAEAKEAELEQDYVERNDELQAKYAASSTDLEQQYARRNADLENTFAVNERTLNERIELAKKQEAERATALATAQKREQDDYAYNLALGRKKEQDTFDATLRQRNVQEQERVRKLEAEWAAKTAELDAAAEELADLRQQVTEFPTKLKDAVARAESIVGNSVKKEYEHRMELAQKDAESAKQLAASNASAQAAVIASQMQQIDKLQSQLEAAQEKVAAISTKALESASGQSTLAEMRNLRRDDTAGKPNGKS